MLHVTYKKLHNLLFLLIHFVTINLDFNGEPKIIKLKKELEKFNLIINERQGLNRPNKIYLLEPRYDKELTNRKFKN